MAPHDEATLRRLQYTVYLTGVFLSMPWKRLLSLNHKQQTIEFKRFRESPLECRIKVSVQMRRSTHKAPGNTLSPWRIVTALSFITGHSREAKHSVLPATDTPHFDFQRHTKQSILFRERITLQDTIISASLWNTYSCSLRDGRSPSRNFTSFSHRLSINASCLSGSRIRSKETTLFITLSTSAQNKIHSCLKLPAATIINSYLVLESSFCWEHLFCIGKNCKRYDANITNVDTDQNVQEFGSCGLLLTRLNLKQELPLVKTEFGI